METEEEQLFMGNSDAHKEYLQKYSSAPGQNTANNDTPEQPAEKASSMMVSEQALKEYINKKVAYIKTSILKLAALESKGKLLKDSIAGVREPPSEWCTQREPPVLPAGITYSFTVTLDLDSLQSKFDRDWMSKVQQDITNVLIPKLTKRIESMQEEAVEDITTELGKGAVGNQGVKLFKEQVASIKNDRAKTYSENQQASASGRMKRRSNPSGPFRPPFKQRNGNQRQPTKQRQHQGKPSYKKAGWFTPKDQE